MRPRPGDLFRVSQCETRRSAAAQRAKADPPSQHKPRPIELLRSPPKGTVSSSDPKIGLGTALLRPLGFGGRSSHCEERMVGAERFELPIASRPSEGANLALKRTKIHAQIIDECYDSVMISGMASLHRDPRGKSPFWYVSFRTPDGRQCFRSTKETERRKAEAFAVAIEASLGKVKIGSLTETAARTILADLYQKVSGQALHFTTIQEWFQSCLNRVQKLRGKTTHDRYKAVTEHFVRFLGPVRAKAPLESLHADEIQRFTDGRLAEGRSAKTVQNDLKPIGKFLKDAERKGLILRTPMGNVEVPEAVGETRDPFSEGELSALLSHLSAKTDAADKALAASDRNNRCDWKTAVNLGLYAGMRLGDCTNLRWSSVDFGRKQIRFVPEKSRKKEELVIPMHPDLESYLLSLPVVGQG